MQHRLRSRPLIEISGLAPLQDIGYETRARRSLFAQFAEFIRGECKGAVDQACRQHHDERRENAPEATRIEALERESLALQVVKNQTRNQEAGNDEKNINAGESAAQCPRKCVKPHDTQDSNRPQAIDVGSICSPCRRRAQPGEQIGARPNVQSSSSYVFSNTFSG